MKTRPIDYAMLASSTVLMAKDWGTSWGWVWLVMLVAIAAAIASEAKDKKELNFRTGLGTLITLTFSTAYSICGAVVVGVAFILLFSAAVFEVVSYLSTRKN